MRILLTLAILAAIALVVVPKNGLGPDDLPLGTDFSQVWVAGREALAGAPEAPYDLPRHADAQRAAFGENTGVFGWHYPPYFLVPAAALARLPYFPALALWQVSTLIAYLIVIVPILKGAGFRRSDAVAAALAFPAVYINFGHGQNAFLTAALLGGGFRLLESRPLIAGALFALLAFKPQFALILPFTLLIERRWRVLASAAATLFAMTVASVVDFGPNVWRAFFGSLSFTRQMAENGSTGFEKIQSAFAAARLLGAGVETAYLCQGLVATVVFVALARLLLSPADSRVKAAATIVAMFLTTPYILDYDMVALAPALAFLLAQGRDTGFAPFEKTTLAGVYAVPLLARPVAGLLALPVGAFAILALFASIARRSGAQRSRTSLVEPSSGGRAESGFA